MNYQTVDNNLTNNTQQFKIPVIGNKLIPEFTRNNKYFFQR